MPGAEKNYSATELEALGVIWVVKHFGYYLYGHKCQIFTDHQALKALLNTFGKIGLVGTCTAGT